MTAHISLAQFTRLYLPKISAHPWLEFLQVIRFAFWPINLIPIIEGILFILTDVVIPWYFPTSVQRYLWPRPPSPQISGDSLLCSLCQTLLDKIEVNIDGAWGSYRHHDDIAFLRQSAIAGCQICIKLLNWVDSIENGPDWSEVLGGPVPWGFTIRCSLLKDVTTTDQLELLFKIYRFESIWSHVDDLSHVMRLKIIRVEQPKEFENDLRIGNSTCSKESLALMRTWMERCDKQHSECMRQHTNQSESWRPTRLLFVGSSDSSSSPRLCIGSKLPADVKYMTLSHRWGGQAIPHRLLTENLEALQLSVPADELPQCFQHAMLVTEFFGIEYLWIDSLCIIQDSESDWAIESAKMGSVYTHSYCNIAATGFPNSTHGLFVKRDPRMLQPSEIKISARLPADNLFPNGSYYCLADLWENEVVKAPLNQRGWVFQERCLSPRIIHFGARQLLWECLELEACEMFPRDLPTAFATNYKKENPFRAGESSRTDESLLEAWCNAVSVYSGCDLTKIDDKLVALSGIAATVSKMHSGKYLAGVWDRGLPYHLLWFIDIRLALSALGVTVQRSDQAPSWSWASIDGKVTFLVANGRAWPRVKILDAEITLVDNQEFGRVSGGFIRLRGRVCQAQFKETNTALDKPGGMPWISSLILKAWNPDADLTLAFVLFPDIIVRDDLNHQIRIVASLGGKRNFFLLFLCNTYMRVQGLILEHTGVKGQFRRLGMFFSESTNPQMDHHTLITGHKPVLEPAHYEEYHDEDGHSTITII